MIFKKCRVKTDDVELLAGARFFQELGMASFIMASCRNYKLFQIACQTMWIEPAIHHHQIQFFYEDDGRLIGYSTWAYLTPEVEERLLNDANFVMHASEWCEGEQVWIMDFAAPLGHARDLLLALGRDVFPDIPVLKYVRRDNKGNIRKQVAIKNRYFVEGACPSTSS